MQDNHVVYVKTDEDSTIIDINSSSFLTDFNGWTQIDEGIGDKYHHAQGHYFENGLIDENGCYNYKLVDGTVMERTVSEKQADIENGPAPAPTPDEKMAELQGRLDTIDGAFLDVLLNIIPTMGV